MNKKIVGLFVLVALLIVGCSELNIDTSNLLGEKSSETKVEEVIVKRVVDGDTIVVERQSEQSAVDTFEEKVRLLLIDTPESVHPEKEPELYGEKSSEYVKSLLKENDTVELEIGEVERDKYDRLLAYVWVDGKNLNKHLIEQGYARVAYVYEPNVKYLDEFEKAEQDAKNNKKNIWSIDGYVTENGFDMSVVK